MAEIAGYIGALLIGVSLGLIGSGGSILTVPILVYLFHIDALLATGYSLFVVGVTALFGAFTYWRRQLVDVKTAIWFGMPAIVAVYATRHYLVPALPQHLFSIGSFTVSLSMGLMLLFAILMLLAAGSMIWTKKGEEQAEQPTVKKITVSAVLLILLEGTVVGTLTGLVGAGGGFLIIPALVFLTKLPMKKAVGTSLLIIAAKSLLGYLGEVQATSPNWSFLLLFTGIAVVGLLIGAYAAKFIDGKKLKPLFGWFVLAMGVYVIIKELVLN